GEIYRDVHDHLRPGGIFLNVDLFNAPTVGLSRKYEAVMARRRQREDASAPLEALVRGEGRSSTTATTGPFPGDLAQHLDALGAARFTEVDCFWKDLRRALIGGYA